MEIYDAILSWMNHVPFLTQHENFEDYASGALFIQILNHLNSDFFGSTFQVFPFSTRFFKTRSSNQTGPPTQLGSNSSSRNSMLTLTRSMISTYFRSPRTQTGSKLWRCSVPSYRLATPYASSFSKASFKTSSCSQYSNALMRSKL